MINRELNISIRKVFYEKGSIFIIHIIISWKCRCTSRMLLTSRRCMRMRMLRRDAVKCRPYYDCGNQETKQSVKKPNNQSELNDSTYKAEDNSASNSQEIVSFNVNSLKYHCPSCKWAIKCTRNCISVTRAKAMELGGVPCKVCGGRCK